MILFKHMLPKKYFPWVLWGISFFCVLSPTVMAGPQQRDSITIKKLLYRAAQFRSRNIDSALADAEKALQIARILSDQALQANAQMLLGSIHGNKTGEDHLSISENHTRAALDIYTALADTSHIIACHNNLGLIYKEKNLYQLAAKHLTKVVVLCYKYPNSDRHDLGKTYGNLGNLYLDLELYDSALICHQKSYDYFTEANSPFRTYASANIGISHLNLKNYDLAEVYLEQAKDSIPQESNLLFHAKVLSKLAKINRETDRPDQSEQYYREAIQLFEDHNFLNEVCISSIGLAKLLRIKEDYPGALALTDRVIRLADSLTFYNHLIRGLEIKADLLAKLNKKEEAYEVFSRMKELNDSLSITKKLPNSMAGALVALDKMNTEEADTGRGSSPIKSLASWPYMPWMVLVGVMLILTVFIRKTGFFGAFNTAGTTDSNALANGDAHHEIIEKHKRVRASDAASAAIKADLIENLNKNLDNIKAASKDRAVVNEVISAQKKIAEQLGIEKEWDNFFKHFVEVHPDFYEKLIKIYNLTQNDIKVCAFLKMSMSHKEIARLLNISPNSLRIKIYRLKKKILADQDIDDLQSYLISLK